MLRLVGVVSFLCACLLGFACGGPSGAGPAGDAAGLALEPAEDAAAFLADALGDAGEDLAVSLGAGDAGGYAGEDAILPPLPGEASRDFADFPGTRVALEDCQRDARELPAGLTRIDLRAPAGAEALHVAFRGSASGAVRAGVYQEGNGAPLGEAACADTWTWLRAPLSGGGEVSLVFESPGSFEVAWFHFAGPRPAAPDVIVYLIDTLRKDHLGCYGYPLETSPRIDAFAEDGVLFHEMIPMSSWTRPSVATMLTGTLDHTHHSLGLEDPLREGLPSLAWTLREAGWLTHGIVTNPNVTAEFGFGGDFHWYEEVMVHAASASPERDIEAVRRALEVIDASAGAPLFLYLHTMAPHRDYAPPDAYRDLFMPDFFVGTRPQTRILEDMALYNGEIRFSDDLFGAVVERLRETGRYEDALIVLVSDHGEQFMEHGRLAHAQSLHYHELGIPFVAKFPGNAHAGSSIRHVTSMADIAPTILDALGLGAPAEMEGRSLMPLLTLEGDFPMAPVFARLRFDERHYHMGRSEDLKYIYDHTREEATWYNLLDDPEEKDPLRTPPPGGEDLQAFADAAAALPVPEAGSGGASLTDRQIETLEALGYL